MTIDVPEPEPGGDPFPWRGVGQAAWRVGRSVGDYLYHRHTHHESENHMPAVFVPGGPYIPPGTAPLRLLHVNGTGSSEFDALQTNTSGRMWVVCGIDAVCTDLGSVSAIECDASVGGVTFYHDSQSIGEGGGVTFAWRGQHQMYPEDDLLVTLKQLDVTTEANVMAWGLEIQNPWTVL